MLTPLMKIRHIMVLGYIYASHKDKLPQYLHTSHKSKTWFLAIFMPVRLSIQQLPGLMKLNKIRYTNAVAQNYLNYHLNVQGMNVIKEH